MQTDPRDVESRPIAHRAVYKAGRRVWSTNDGRQSIVDSTCMNRRRLSETSGRHCPIPQSVGARTAPVPNTHLLPVMCTFPLFVARCHYNPPTLQTDEQTGGRTDGRRDVMPLAFSTTCYIGYSSICRAKRGGGN